MKEEVNIKMFLKNWDALLNRITVIFIGHLVFINGKMCHFSGANQLEDLSMH